MKRKSIQAGLALVLVILGLALWRLAPTILSLEPASGPLHGQQPVQVTFSRAMQTGTVASHLTIRPEVQRKLIWDESRRVLTIQPQEDWPAGSTVTLTVRAGARAGIRLPMLFSSTRELTVSPILLAYLWPADATSDLYLFNPASGVSRALISRPQEITDFTVSPDGLTIYFSSFSPEGDSIIFRYDRLTGRSTPLINCGSAVCQNPSLSPDGTLMLYEHILQQPRLNPGIDLYTLETGETEPLGPPEDHLTHPAWGPEGWVSYYNRSQESYRLVNQASGEQRSLPNQTGGPGTWSFSTPAFVTTEIYNLSDTLAPRHLLRYLPGDESLTDLTQDNFLEDANPVYSPDGTRLAFGRKSLEPSRWTPGRQLWIREEDSGQAYPLTSAVDYNHTGFNWHPAGSVLAYVRYNQAELAEAPEIWMIDLISGENSRLIINGFAPQWIP